MNSKITKMTNVSQLRRGLAKSAKTTHTGTTGTGSTAEFRSRTAVMLEVIGRSLHAESVVLALVDGDGETTICDEWHGASASSSSSWLSSGEFSDFCLRVAGLPAVAHWSRRDITSPNWDGPALAIPLRRSSREIGVLWILKAEDQPDFSADDFSLLTTFCEALDHGSLDNEAHLFRQVRLLNHVSQQIALAPDPDVLLTNVLGELDRFVPRIVCAVWLVDDDLASTESGASVLRVSHISNISNASKPAGLSLGTAILFEQTPLFPNWRDGRGHCGYWPWHADETDTQRLSCFTAALRVGDRVVGMLQCFRARSSGFSFEQVQLFYQVADLLGAGLSNCRLIARLRTTCHDLRNAHESLIRTEKMRALGELASGVAHDFNNALSATIGFLDIVLRSHSFEPNVARNLGLARASADDAANVVERLLNFSRTRRDELADKILEVNQLVSGTLELCQPKITDRHKEGRKPIIVDTELAARSCILGNGSELREALFNLVFNAIDAMPEGGRLILRTWEDESHVCIEVKDNGIGMCAETRKRLFEPFFTTKGERGTGLGLSVTFSIIQRHNATIDVVSEARRGTTFVLRFVKAKPSDRPALPHHDETIHEGQATVMLRRNKKSPRRILVVEDEEPVGLFLKSALELEGYIIEWARTGQEGIDALSRERFDLVITDLGLPDISGDHVAKHSAAVAPATPVILLTGWGSQLINEGRKFPGVTRILAKPIALKDLRSAVKNPEPACS